jgi:hypothetical protein
MQVILNNIWTEANREDIVVIPTNVGWRKDGTNVMGRGLALQAARKWHSLPMAYGGYCQLNTTNTGPQIFYPPDTVTLPCKGLLLVPVKQLNVTRPNMSWDSPASLPYIAGMTERMQQMAPHLECARILVPSLGCGNGGLKKEVVWPLLHRNLVDPKFVLVDMKP